MTRYDILTATPTAFHSDGSLDLEGSRAIFRFVGQSGNEGAFVLGTTGEFPTVDAEEFTALVGPADFELYTGADRDLIDAVEAGAQGVVSGVSSVTPKPFRALADAGRSGDAAAIAAAQADVDQVVSLIGGDMARMKEAYRVLGVTDAHCRMAIADVDAEREAVRIAAV